MEEGWFDDSLNEDEDGIKSSGAIEVVDEDERTDIIIQRLGSFDCKITDPDMLDLSLLDKFLQRSPCWCRVVREFPVDRCFVAVFPTGSFNKRYRPTGKRKGTCQCELGEWGAGVKDETA